MNQIVKYSLWNIPAFLPDTLTIQWMPISIAEVLILSSDNVTISYSAYNICCSATIVLPMNSSYVYIKSSQGSLPHLIKAHTDTRRYQGDWQCLGKEQYKSLEVINKTFFSLAPEENSSLFETSQTKSGWIHCRPKSSDGVIVKLLLNGT